MKDALIKMLETKDKAFLLQAIELNKMTGILSDDEIGTIAQETQWTKNSLNWILLEHTSFFDNLTQLSLYNKKLEELPYSINKLKNLEFLDLRGNYLNIEINLPKLEEFKVCGKSICTFINRNKKLWTELSLDDTNSDKIKDFTEIYPFLDSLEIDCSNSSYLDKSIALFKQLKQLSAHSNKIKSIPDFITSMDIELLDLRDNQIKSIPKSISNMKELKFLYLSNNKIKDIPTELLELKLDCLDISENILPIESKELIKSHFSHIFSIFILGLL